MNYKRTPPKSNAVYITHVQPDDTCTANARCCYPRTNARPPASAVRLATHVSRIERTRVCSEFAYTMKRNHRHSKNKSNSQSHLYVVLIILHVISAAAGHWRYGVASNGIVIESEHGYGYLHTHTNYKYPRSGNATNEFINGERGGNGLQRTHYIRTQTSPNVSV